MNDFDRIAPVYDKLARLVFGNVINTSQTAFLHILKPNDTVLICGGGTGWILCELDKLNIPLSVEYLESSFGMINKAIKREPFKNLHVVYIQKDIFDTQLNTYNVVITNFFLDVFSKPRLIYLSNHLQKTLVESGSWLVTDFRNSGKWKHRTLSFLMHLFFSAVCSIESNRLQNFEEILREFGLSLKERKYFYDEFIGSYHFQLI